MVIHLRAFGLGNPITPGSGAFVSPSLGHHFLTFVLSPSPTPNGHWRFLVFQTLGIIHIGHIYARLAYTKWPLELFTVPDARYY